MQHPLPVGTRCRLSRSHIEILRREGRNLSEAQQTLTILRSGIVGRDISNDDFIYQNGDVGYIVQYDDSKSTCPIGAEELDEHYNVIPNSATPTSQIASASATKEYAKPKGCFNPSCETGKKADKHCAKCRWARYCSIDCQKCNWKDHKKECHTLQITHEAMFGRENYIYNDRASMQTKPTRWNVNSINGNILSLEMQVLGRSCSYSFTVTKDDLANDANLLIKVADYIASGRGCSVDMQRRGDGKDVLVAVHNSNIPL